MRSTLRHLLRAWRVAPVSLLYLPPALVLIGSLGPWYQVDGFVRGGLDLDGPATAALAAIAVVLLAAYQVSGRTSLLAGLLVPHLGMALVAIAAWQSVGAPVSAPANAVDFDHAWGLHLATGAAVAGAMAALVVLVAAIVPRPVSRPRATDAVYATANGERGQALVLFAAGIIAFCGLVALSVDVGRYVWARTQIQSAVDAAALAGAQSMPNVDQAASIAEFYWDDNTQAIQSTANAANVTVDFPGGTNRGVHVRGEATVPTIFAQVFGLDSWDISAEAWAESQVLDIAVVLDISGSMCNNSYPDLELPGYAVHMSPGSDPPQLTSPIPSGGSDTITIRLNDNSMFRTTNAYSNYYEFGLYTNTRYYDYRFSYGTRKGMIGVPNAAGQFEYFQILDAGPTGGWNGLDHGELRVRRAMSASPSGPSTMKLQHAAGAPVWANRIGCNLAAPNGGNGPFEPYDTMVDNAQFFSTLFNSYYDTIGLVSYSSTADREQWLTSSFGTVRSAMDSMPYPGGATNIAHGLAQGRQLLSGYGSRENATRILVLLTDGVANYYCGSSHYGSGHAYSGSSCSGPNHDEGTARAHALAEVARAASEGTIVYTIGLGNATDPNFLSDAADIGGGEYYASPTADELDEAFADIAAATRIELTR